MNADDLDPAIDYIFTIGHSNTPVDVLLGNLRAYGIEALVDVRSQPVSRFAPQFNRRSLESSVTAGGVLYVFAGDGLGGRPKDPDLYDESGHVRYELLAIRRKSARLSPPLAHHPRAPGSRIRSRGHHAHPPNGCG